MKNKFGNKEANLEKISRFLGDIDCRIKFDFITNFKTNVDINKLQNYKLLSIDFFLLKYCFYFNLKLKRFKFMHIKFLF